MTPKTVLPFQMADLDGLEWVPDDLRVHMRLLLGKTHAWTGRINGRIVAVAGITDLHDGVGEAWSYLTDEALYAPLWLHKAVKGEIDRLAPVYRRLQASTPQGFLAGCLWLERLGFHVETFSRLAGPQGETMARYVRFPEEGP